MKPPTGKNIKCKFCHKCFYIPKNRFLSAVYCSRSCKAKSTRIQIKKKCEVCQKEFEHISSRCNTAKYCSRACYYKSNYKKGSIEHECFHCHKKFWDSPSKKRKYCSKACVNKESKKTFQPNYTTVRKAMLNRDMIKECEKCGYNAVTSILGVHHKDGNKRNNTITNLVVLCPNCHSLEHNKHICH